ncbi:MAG: hypothetical protein HND48_05145 [Chloroflexi bacterium]|nr:hypothetical protein [Chloroflexota bacterium]
MFKPSSIFELRYDWDLCMVAPPWSFAGGDYGLQEAWQGAPNGERVAVRRPIRRSLDWTDLRPAEPSKGELGRLAETIAAVLDGLQMTGVPVVVGVLSPLTQAERLVGRELAHPTFTPAPGSADDRLEYVDRIDRPVP